jgi:pantothenate kinase-related protein Tda10
MKEVREFGQLVERVRGHLESDRAIIGVDGAYGSGKSTLARKLAEALEGAVLEIDQYTLRNGQPYRQQLRYEELGRGLEALRSKGKPVVVEGICLLDVLERIGARPGTVVYVKKLDESGIWHDQDTCDPDWIDLDSASLQLPGAAVAREVAAYHKDRDPLASADIVFIRVEGPGGGSNLHER